MPRARRKVNCYPVKLLDIDSGKRAFSIRGAGAVPGAAGGCRLFGNQARD